ncbi:RHOMBOID-like protein 4 (AtRBL4), partial [Durusdinium trenchii]
MNAPPTATVAGEQFGGRVSDAQSPRAYRRVLRQASSYASFNVRPEDQPKGLFGIFHTGKPWVCRVILLVCTVMLIVEFALNDWKAEPLNVNPTFGPSTEVLLDLGAKRTDLILDGDWYRLIAPIFLHAGVLHFLFNMYGLYSIGFPLEIQFGSLAVAYIFLLSGFMGVIMSAVFSPKIVGIGASGGIFGLFGSAWSELILNYSLYRGQVCSSFMQLFIATAINLLLGLMPLLDNFAHIAGFFTGLVCGFAVLVSNRYTRQGEKKERKRYQVLLQIFSVICTPIMVVCALFILYFGVEPDEWCSWCKYLSCVPFPPGDNPWWTCDLCADSGVSFTPIGATLFGTVQCPDGALINATASSDITSSDQDVVNTALIELCRA